MMIAGIRHHAEVSYRHVPCASDQMTAPAMRRIMRPQHPPPPPELPDGLAFRDHQIGMMIHPLSSANSFLSWRLMEKPPLPMPTVTRSASPPVPTGDTGVL